MQHVAGKIDQVFTLALVNTLIAVLNLLAAPFLVRWLSLDEFGTYSQALMICLIFQTLTTFSLHQTIAPLLTRFTGNRVAVLKTIFRIFFFSSFICGLLLVASVPLIIYFFNNNTLIDLLPGIFIYFVGQALLPILNAALYYFGKVSRAAMLNFSFSLLRIISMFIIIHWIGDLKLMLVVMGLGSIVHGCFLFYSIPGTVRGLWGYDSSVMRSAIQIARPLTIGSFLERILYNVDGLTISILLSSGMFAFYRAGAIDVPFISSMGLALFSVMMPQIANRFAQGDLLGIVQLKRNAMVGTAFLTYPILIYVAIFHQQIVRFYLTEAYMPSALVFAIYNFTILLKVYDWQDVIVLSGRSRQIMVYTAMALFLNLILAPILTLRIGIEGAALAFVLSLFFLAFVQLKAIAAILETRIVDLIDLLSVFKIILVSLMVALFALFVCRYFELSDFTAFILFIPYIIITYWFNRKLGLLPKEIQRFLSSRLPFIFEQ